MTIEALDYVPVATEAEQALLGAILSDNAMFDQVAEIVSADHFASPEHSLIWNACATIINQGRVASPLTLKNHLADLAILEDIGGTDYLSRVAAAILSPRMAPDYAREVRDTHVRRQMLGLAADLRMRASRGDYDDPPARILEDADNAVMALRSAWTIDRRPTDMATHVAAADAEILGAFQKGAPVAGRPTGLRMVDAKLKAGLNPGDLVIVAARPSMGKTALALQIGEFLTRQHGEPGHIGSLEMSGQQLVTRMIAANIGISGERLKSGEITEAEYNRHWLAKEELAQLPIEIDDRSVQSPSTIRAAARATQRKYGRLGYIVVDYLQIMAAAEGRRAQSRNDEITGITSACKQMARDLGVPFILLSQLSRDVEKRNDKRPLLSDLRDGGSIEQDADVVMFLYRPEYYLEREQPQRHDFKTEDLFLEAEANWGGRLANARGKAEIIIAKNRSGPTGTAHVWFDKALTRFSDFGETEIATPPAEQILF